MVRDATPIEARLIDYLYRNGGVGTREALTDYLELIEDRDDAEHVLFWAARDGLLRSAGSDVVLYAVNPADLYNGDDGL